MILDFSNSPVCPSVLVFPVEYVGEDTPTPPNDLIETATLNATATGTQTIAGSVDTVE